MFVGSTCIRKARLPTTNSVLKVVGAFVKYYLLQSFPDLKIFITYILIDFSFNCYLTQNMLGKWLPLSLLLKYSIYLSKCGE